MAESTPGRPRRSSRATLLDAAAELFLEQGYEKTSIDQIAQRAGVARATFFNYFSAKGDLLWAELDPLLQRFGSSEGAFSDRGAASTALVDLAGQVDSAPVVMLERVLMGTANDLAVAGLPRMLALTTAVRDRLNQGGYPADRSIGARRGAGGRVRRRRGRLAGRRRWPRNPGRARGARAGGPHGGRVGGLGRWQSRRTASIRPCLRREPTRPSEDGRWLGRRLRGYHGRTGIDPASPGSLRKNGRAVRESGGAQ